VAKVTRDREMLTLHGQYPSYGFDRHKGTRPLTISIAVPLRIFDAHRKSFRPQTSFDTIE
jgi:ribonuclease HII